MTTITDLLIDPEFESLLRPLTEEEDENLENSILEEGFSDPIIVWREHNIVIDGHNRIRIWKEKLNADESLAPQIVEKSFANRDEVKEFIFLRQLARRNLSDAMRIKICLQLKPLLAQKAKENQTAGQVLMNSSKPLNTRKEIAERADASEQSVSKVERVLKSAPAEIQDAMLAGEISINAAHKSVPADEIKIAGDTSLESSESGPADRDKKDDPEMKKCPPHIVSPLVVARSNRAAVVQLRQALKTIVTNCELPGGSWMTGTKQEFERLIGQAILELKSTTYECLCPKCKFGEPNRNCVRCGGRGFLDYGHSTRLSDEEEKWVLANKVE